MACCGENADAPRPINDEAAGSVLVQALWAGNRQQRGAVTGTLYPRAGNGALMWVDARDVAHSPHLWQQVVETPKPPERVRLNEFQAFAHEALGAPGPQPRIVAQANPTNEPIRPDVLRVLELYRKAVAHGV